MATIGQEKGDGLFLQNDDNIVRPYHYRKPLLVSQVPKHRQILVDDHAGDDSQPKRVLVDRPCDDDDL